MVMVKYHGSMIVCFKYVKVSSKSFLFYWSVALLDCVIDRSGAVADLTNLLVVFIANLLLGWFILGDVGVVTLFH